MNISEDYLKELGFVGGFVHLRKEDRDGKERLNWFGIVNDKIVTIRLVLHENNWEIDYLSPKDELNKLTDINDVVNYIETVQKH